MSSVNSMQCCTVITWPRSFEIQASSSPTASYCSLVKLSVLIFIVSISCCLLSSPFSCEASLLTGWTNSLRMNRYCLRCDITKYDWYLAICVSIVIHNSKWSHINIWFSFVNLVMLNNSTCSAVRKFLVHKTVNTLETIWWNYDRFPISWSYDC